jgi:hypothetical protein
MRAFGAGVRYGPVSYSRLHHKGDCMSLNGSEAADREEQLDARLADLLHEMRERHFDLQEVAQAATP